MLNSNMTRAQYLEFKQVVAAWAERHGFPHYVLHTLLVAALDLQAHMGKETHQVSGEVLVRQLRKLAIAMDEERAAEG